MKLKLTTMGRLVIFVIVLAVLGTAAYFGYPLIKDKLPGKSDAVSGKSSTVSGDIGGTAANLHASDGNNVINLSLDEWVGYRTIVKANGGFETQPGSGLYRLAYIRGVQPDCFGKELETAEKQT